MAIATARRWVTVSSSSLSEVATVSHRLVPVNPAGRPIYQGLTPDYRGLTGGLQALTRRSHPGCGAWPSGPGPEGRAAARPGMVGRRPDHEAQPDHPGRAGALEDAHRPCRRRHRTPLLALTAHEPPRSAPARAGRRRPRPRDPERRRGAGDLRP